MGRSYHRYDKDEEYHDVRYEKCLDRSRREAKHLREIDNPKPPMIKRDDLQKL